jgi:membrane protein implicated in regulation of membrane protease activity
VSLKIALVLFGILAWAGVALLGVLMAELEWAVAGYFVLLVAVAAAWIAGEFVSRRLQEER